MLASSPAHRLFADLLPWLALILGLVVVGGIVITFVRRSLRDKSGGGAGGFTLQDLRELHAAGELSDEEFERAKAGVVGRLTEDRTTSENTDGPPPDAAGSDR